jgi:hypothetical protein
LLLPPAPMEAEMESEFDTLRKDLDAVQERVTQASDELSAMVKKVKRAQRIDRLKDIGIAVAIALLWLVSSTLIVYSLHALAG